MCAGKDTVYLRKYYRVTKEGEANRRRYGLPYRFYDAGACDEGELEPGAAGGVPDLGGDGPRRGHPIATIFNPCGVTGTTERDSVAPPSGQTSGNTVVQEETTSGR